MASTKAATPAAYLAELAPDNRRVIAAVRDVVNQHLPSGYVEGMQYGMITWCVPLSRYPDTYNGQPIGIAALAAQKQYNALYLMSVYGDPATETWFKKAFAKAGKKLDMGKSCVRFKTVEDLPLDVIGEVIARVPVEALIAQHDRVHGKKAKKQPPAKKPAVKARRTGRG